MRKEASPEKVVQEIRRKTRRRFRAKRRFGSCWRACGAKQASPRCAARRAWHQICTIRWSKEFLEAGKKRLVGDTTREATSTEVTDLRKENTHLKQLVAEMVLENRLLKKTVTASGSEDDTCD